MGDLIQPPKPHLWPAQQGKALREQVWVPRVPGSRDARVAHGDTAGQLLPHVPHLPRGQPLRELRETQVSSTKPEASPGPHGTSLRCRAKQRRPSGHRQAPEADALPVPCAFPRTPVQFCADVMGGRRPLPLCGSVAETCVGGSRTATRGGGPAGGLVFAPHQACPQKPRQLVVQTAGA